MHPKKLVVMISSNVYGIEELLERIYSLLFSSGYEVWMSHKGTMPVYSNKTALENCLSAVDDCDLFLGLITPYYGSSGTSEISFTHEEMRKAIKTKKPRWILAHDHVIFARLLLKDLGYNKENRSLLKINKKASSISDLRVIDMYEEATLDHVELSERRGNWVQKYHSDEDAQLYAFAQFSRYDEVEEFIKENINDVNKILHQSKKEDNNELE